jgi:hypothetical protein
MLTSIPMNGMTYAESLRANFSQKTTGNENIPDFEPPRLNNMERKLQIQAGEWYEESYYKSDDVAALYSFYQPTQGPFIIVPSMSKEEIQSDFVLSSKCNTFHFYRYSFLVSNVRNLNAGGSEQRSPLRQVDGEVSWRVPFV